MKKFLSLVLALVMTMSLVTVSAGAADFTDADDITYVEAVEVMKAVGVVDGDTAGNFNPANGLTRGAAAKIICNMILGPTTAAALNADTNPYPDVDKDSVFAGYIAYCQKEGIISGYADGNFKPAAPLTGYAFMKMLLGALGYDPAVEGYTGANWSINVAKRAISIGLDDGLVDTFNGSDYVTREEAMLYAFNTMLSTMVEYDTTITIGDITVAGSKAAEVEDKNDRNATIATGETLEFAEKYFSKLVGLADKDAFDRPAITWKNGVNKIGTYVVTPELEYTAAVELGQIYKDLGLSKAVTSDERYTDGAVTTAVTLSKGDEATIGANGVLTEVWYDEDASELIISHINTYVGKIGTVVKATAKADAYVTVVKANAAPTALNAKFDTDLFAKDELVMYTAAENTKTGRYDIQSLETLEKTATGVLTEWHGAGVYNTEKGTSTSDFTVGGETYKYSLKYNVANDDGFGYWVANGVAEFAVDESELDVYCDNYGYAIYVSGVEAVENYAVVIGIGESNQYGSETKGVTLLLPDGTQKTVTAKLASTMTAWTQFMGYNGMTQGTWNGNPYKNLVNDGFGDLVTYTVDDDGVYVLTLEQAMDNTVCTTATKFTNGKALFEIDANQDGDADDAGETLYTTSETIFLVATNKKVADSSKGVNYNVYVGYENMPTLAGNKVYGVAYATDDVYGNQINVIYIYATQLEGIAGVDTYFVKNKDLKVETNSNGKYYVLPAIVEGEETTLKIDAQATWGGSGNLFDVNGTTLVSGNFVAAVGMYAIDNVIMNSKGVITSFDVAVFDIGSNGVVAANKVVLGFGADKATAEYWAYDKDTNVYVVDKDYKTISVSSIANISTDDNDQAYAFYNDVNKVLADVVVVEVPVGAYVDSVVPEFDVGYTGSINGTAIFVDAGLTGAAQTEAAVATMKAYGYEVDTVTYGGALAAGETVIPAVKNDIAYTLTVNPTILVLDYIEFGNTCGENGCVEEYVTAYLTYTAGESVTLDDVVVVAYDVEGNAVSAAKRVGVLNGTTQINFYGCDRTSDSWGNTNNVADIDDIAYVALYIDGVEAGTDSDPAQAVITPVV